MVFCTRNAEKYFLVSLCFCKKKNLLKKYSNFLVLSFSLQTKPKKMMVECAFFLVILSIRSFFFHRLLECWSKSRTLDNYVSCMAAKRRRRKKKNWKNRWQNGESCFGLLPLQPTTYTQQTSSTFNKRSEFRLGGATILEVFWLQQSSANALIQCYVDDVWRWQNGNTVEMITLGLYALFIWNAVEIFPMENHAKWNEQNEQNEMQNAILCPFIVSKRMAAGAACRLTVRHIIVVCKLWIKWPPPSARLFPTFLGSHNPNLSSECSDLL